MIRSQTVWAGANAKLAVGLTLTLLVLFAPHGWTAVSPTTQTSVSPTLQAQTNKLYWQKVHQQSRRKKQTEAEQRSKTRDDIRAALPQYVEAGRSTHLASTKDPMAQSQRGLTPESRRNLLLFTLALLLVTTIVLRRFKRQIAASVTAHLHPWMASPSAMKIRALRQIPVQEIRWALDVSGCHDVLGNRDRETGSLTAQTQIQISSGEAAPPRKPHPATTATTAAAKTADAASQTVTLTPEFFAQALFAYMPKHLAILREMLQDISKVTDELIQEEMLTNLFLTVHSLKCKADWAELQVISQVTFALEALVKKISESQKHITPSALRTVANTVDLLEDLCAPGCKADLATASPIRILVVDDDALSRRALTSALQMAFLKPETADNGESALALAAQKPFEVIFLDVQMPDMDGFTVCSGIRGTGPNRQTPIVFVTSQTDFQTRAQSVLSGGNELIAKPFLLIEITVKALTFALRGRLPRTRTDQSQSENETPAPETIPVTSESQNELRTGATTDAEGLMEDSGQRQAA